MIVFIDESGIHKASSQSTAALVYVGVEHLTLQDEAIVQAEARLHIAPFH